ncbi:MAG TPA: outer membrane protein assembly factor BamD [Candidatus Acidoferrum sp.]|jgi:outer membrane protein assembly factor BamD|nr:outer membrane protein assembly factor BamD [Candidatus Acidoferrum sp.]
MSHLSRRSSFIPVLGLVLAITVGCTNKKSVNPLANVGSKQPDKVLFDRSMDAMRHNRFDVARMTLQTLINTYPDSEFIARAKLAVGDSWYAEGGTASLAQAEQEYRDFETFFPNMPEAAEAQLKIANIQYQQMEKSDRDYTHAKRAEDEYRNLIMQYPDNPKLVKEGKLRLLEVQEVLADREFGIGRFYYLRQSFAASIARLQSLVEKYPLYSRADEALYLLGQNYELQIAQLRSRPVCTAAGVPAGCVGKETEKANYIAGLTRQATSAYSQIITRYPVMDRGDDAKKRLAALHQPIPRPTKAAVAQNRKEEESRREATTYDRAMSLLKKGPDTAAAAKVGEPPLVDPVPVAARDVVSTTMRQAMGPAAGEHGVSGEIVKGGPPAANEPAPRSDAPPASANGTPFAGSNTPADPNELKPAAPDANELKPGPPDPNELKPAASPGAAPADAAVPPPVQVNEIQQGQASSGTGTVDSSSSTSNLASDQDISSSKKKKKKGLKKVISF